MVATDQDRGKNSEISYSITHGDPHNQFRIDPVTGWISVAAKLDRESLRSYTLEILALDHGIPQRSGSVMVYIDVTDVNDNPPVFADSNKSLYLQVTVVSSIINSILCSHHVVDSIKSRFNFGNLSFTDSVFPETDIF